MEHKFIQMSENNHYLDSLESDIGTLTSSESIYLLEEISLRVHSELIPHSAIPWFSFYNLSNWFNNPTQPRYFPSQRNLLIENIELRTNLTLLTDATEISGLEVLTNQYDNLFQEIIQKSKSFIVGAPIIEMIPKFQSQKIYMGMLADKLCVMLKKVETQEGICRRTMRFISAIISKLLKCIIKILITKYEVESKYIFFIQHINGFSPKYHFMELYQLNFILIINYFLAKRPLNQKNILSLYSFSFGGRMRH